MLAKRTMSIMPNPTYEEILEINKEFKTTVILRDNSFKNDVDKTNALKRLEQVGISEIRSI